MIGLVFQFLLIGLGVGALLLWLGRLLMRQLGALRWRARRLGRTRGLACVEPLPTVFDHRLDD